MTDWWVHVSLLQFHTRHDIHAGAPVWESSQRKDSGPEHGSVWDSWLVITRAGMERSHQGQPFSKICHRGWSGSLMWGSGLERERGQMSLKWTLNFLWVWAFVLFCFLNSQNVHILLKSTSQSFIYVRLSFLFLSFLKWHVVKVNMYVIEKKRKLKEKMSFIITSSLRL